MQTVLNKIDQLLAGFLALLMTAIVIDVSWQVITRFLLSTPSSYTEELARFLLVWIGLLGASYAYRTRAHLGLDLLTNQLPPKSKALVELIAVFCSATFAVLVMVYGGSQLVLLTFELKQTSASLGIPIGFVYMVIPLSGLLITLYALDLACQYLSTLKSHNKQSKQTQNN